MSPRRVPPDSALVARARGTGPEAGDAFRLLVERHRDPVLARCRSFASSEAEARDLVQETFARAHRGLPSFRGDARFGTWLYRVNLNVCLNAREKERRRRHYPLDHGSVSRSPELSSEPDAESRLVREEETARIDRALSRMSPTLRETLVLRAAEGLSYREIADRLQIGLSAVKMRIGRGRRQFRALYEALGDERLERDAYGHDPWRPDGDPTVRGGPGEDAGISRESPPPSRRVPASARSGAPP